MIDQIKSKFLENQSIDEWYDFVNEIVYTSDTISVEKDLYTKIEINKEIVLNDNEVLIPLWNTDSKNTFYFYNTTKYIWHG